ncbi:MAG: hypothetical protein KF838_06040 [Phycisphaeraceae bacterium]|nr:MAG: hypothetical protein KF838_06040 [Phycisphaeraceae bacterium]
MPVTIDREKHGWAIDIISKHFRYGLAEICGTKFLADRYRAFVRREDPIYATLLNGMDDEPLARTFVSYWTIAHTMATQSRFWLERAVAEILLHQVREKQRDLSALYSQAMLSRGDLSKGVPIATLGEEYLETADSSRAWVVQLQQSALREIDVIIGEQERDRRWKERRPPQPRDWDNPSMHTAIESDHLCMMRICESFKGPPFQDVAIQCNLLVIEPDTLDGGPHAWAFRFVNPKTIASHATRKQERVNMLRLYAYLVQEKILRDPSSLRVAVAALVPRSADSGWQDQHPDYFSTATYWSTQRLWKFIGVPYDAVTTAIENIAGEFRDQLRMGLRALLPETDSKQT